MGEWEGGEISGRRVVQSAICPRVGILPSPAARNAATRNSLTLKQILSPFATLTTDVSWQEPTGQAISPKGLRISLVDITSWKGPAGEGARSKRQLLNVVASRPPPLIFDDSEAIGVKTYKLGGKVASSPKYNVSVPSLPSWYLIWRAGFLDYYSAEVFGTHEFSNHLSACVLLVSVDEIENVEEVAAVIARLAKCQSDHQASVPHTWLLSSVLKYYVLISEGREEPGKADLIYAALRTLYGGNFCHLLRLNSGSGHEPPIPNFWDQSQQENTKESDELGEYEENHSPVPVDLVLHPLSPDVEIAPPIPQVVDGAQTGGFLTGTDLQNIQVAMNEFIGKALFPYIERQAKVLYDSIVNRRGMSKSFFSATKRLFGGSGKAIPNSVIYTLDSAELLSRKLADIYFLFGHYNGAYQVYHSLKKDFTGDGAWVHAAGALEMAALSHFMMGPGGPGGRPFPLHYVTEAIGHYADLCRMSEAAVRTAILATECLKDLEAHGDAAALFIRLTAEDCDLRSALFLEQASYCFLKLNSPRKFALHSVLAGHRYSKAGLRKHSLNCYLQAGAIYETRGWRYAEDHVSFTVARHLAHLGLDGGIVDRIGSLLKTPTPQPINQQAIFFKEFIAIMTKLFEDTKTIRNFFIPKVLCEEMRVTIGSYGLSIGELAHFPPLPDEYNGWEKLEESALREAVEPPVINFKPTRLLFHRLSDNTSSPSVPSNEMFYFDIPFENPLKIDIELKRLGLVFNIPDTLVRSSLVEELSLLAGEVKVVRFGVLATQPGLLILKGVSFEFERIPFTQSIILPGLRLNSTKAEKCGKIYSKDFRNIINVIQPLPLLQAEVEELPNSGLIAGQEIKFTICLRNVTLEGVESEKNVEKIILSSEVMPSSLDVENDSVQHKGCHSIVTFPSNCGKEFRLPCLYRVPEEGDCAQLRILVLFLVTGLCQRILRLSIRLPLISAVKFSTITCKKINSFSSLRILRVENLSEESVLTVTGLSFIPEKYSIEEVSGSSNETIEHRILPLEARTLILRLREVAGSGGEDLSLCVRWVLSRPNGNVEGCHRLPIQIDPFLQKNYSFTLRHSGAGNNNFSTSPAFILPVELLITARRMSRALVEITRPEEVKLEGDINENSSPYSNSNGVFFVGQKSWRVDLVPLEVERLVYSVALTRPGLHNIGPRVRVLDPATRVEEETIDLHSPFLLSKIN